MYLQQNLPTLTRCDLFKGVAAEQLLALLDCLGTRVRSYHKGEFILRAGECGESVGVLIEGSADVIREDFWGNRAIIARLLPADLFAEAFVCAGVERLPVSVVSLNTTTVLFLDFKRIIGVCSAACAFHSSLIGNMLRVLASKNVNLTRKLEDLTQRSTREKLLSYLSRQAAGAGRASFAIPFNRRELADYLGVDRSALSAEMSRMRDAGLIRYRKNHFELLQAVPGTEAAAGA
ncbi:MAG: Crp/Fnr family transcriptional regulator [Coriobacteriales bacterium]|nr:Crp/Fnr family transcriptional regulator [Coriobacteriales bacterium]